MFTCFQGGVGHTLLGSHLWKTLSGCFQLDRNKFTCFPHSVDWSSTYIKDLDRVDFISLGVSQHKSLIFTLTASYAHSWRAKLSLLQRPDAKSNSSELHNRPNSMLSSWSTCWGPVPSLGFPLKPKPVCRSPIPHSSLVEDGFPNFRT